MEIGPEFAGVARGLCYSTAKFAKFPRNAYEHTISRMIEETQSELEHRTTQIILQPMKPEAESQPAPQESKPTKKPRLIVTQTKNGVPVEAVCSNCPEITFHLGFTHLSLAEHLSALKAMFDRHIQAAHAKL